MLLLETRRQFLEALVLVALPHGGRHGLQRLAALLDTDLGFPVGRQEFQGILADLAGRVRCGGLIGHAGFHGPLEPGDVRIAGSLCQIGQPGL